MSEITHARVARIAVPVVLSNATVPLLGAVDTAVIGQLGQAAPLGAVGMGAVEPLRSSGMPAGTAGSSVASGAQM